LFALVAGDIEHIHDVSTTGSGRQVVLKIYSEKENIDFTHNIYGLPVNIMGTRENLQSPEVYAHSSPVQ
jgi:hypothetical protein